MTKLISASMAFSILSLGRVQICFKVGVDRIDRIFDKHGHFLSYRYQTTKSDMIYKNGRDDVGFCVIDVAPWK